MRYPIKFDFERLTRNGFEDSIKRLTERFSRREINNDHVIFVPKQILLRILSFSTSVIVDHAPLSPVARNNNNRNRYFYLCSVSASFTPRAGGTWIGTFRGWNNTLHHRLIYRGAFISLPGPLIPLLRWRFTRSTRLAPGVYFDPHLLSVSLPHRSHRTDGIIPWPRIIPVVPMLNSRVQLPNLLHDVDSIHYRPFDQIYALPGIGYGVISRFVLGINRSPTFSFK